jgi:hypothetical protein
VPIKEPVIQQDYKWVENTWHFGKNARKHCQPLNEKNLKIFSIAALPKGHGV